MGKKEELLQKVNLIIDDPGKLETFLIENSNLPGPRANLELAFTLSEVYENVVILTKWAEIDADRAGVDDPRSFLPFCAAVALGKLYAKTGDEKILRILKRMAGDGRWRIREAVAFGFQRIGEDDFSTLRRIFSDWIAESGNREKRAILVALAHPKILDRDATLFCCEILENVFENLQKDRDFEILKKGLEFVISVYTAAYPEYGFSFMERWIGRDAVIDGIIGSNLKKNRLSKKHPRKIAELLGKL
jgi:hypothetical protein